MRAWMRLDLRSKWDRPDPGQLVALRMTPTGPRATFYREVRYDIGQFEAAPKTGRKLWWHGTRGCDDPIRLKNHYEIWWCPVPRFDELPGE